MCSQFRMMFGATVWSVIVRQALFAQRLSRSAWKEWWCKTQRIIIVAFWIPYFPETPPYSPRDVHQSLMILQCLFLGETLFDQKSITTGQVWLLQSAWKCHNFQNQVMIVSASSNIFQAAHWHWVTNYPTTTWYQQVGMLLAKDSVLCPLLSHEKWEVLGVILVGKSRYDRDDLPSCKLT